MKSLTIARHAKSSWKEPLTTDFDRPLNDRGRRDAPEVGKRLAARGFSPGLVITSPAKRARKTAKILAGQIGYDAKKIVLAPTIYEASLATLMGLVRGLDDGFESVMIVGHNPGVTELANALMAEGRIDNLTTCAAVSLQFPVGSWLKIGKGTGVVRFFEAPPRAGRGGD